MKKLYNRNKELETYYKEGGKPLPLDQDLDRVAVTLPGKEQELIAELEEK